MSAPRRNTPSISKPEPSRASSIPMSVMFSHRGSSPRAPLGLYAVHFRRFRKHFEGKAVDQITIRMIAEMLDALTPRTASQCRALLIDIFNQAAAKGLCPDNPAASTINRIEKKQRKRYAVEGLRAVREKSPAWLQNAIDLALITAQRRTDILNMRFDGVREGFLYVVQQKTTKASDAAWIRFKVTEELQAVISRCRDDIASPYLVRRRPDRLKQKQAQTKDHSTQVEERYLTRAFKEARELAGCYKGWRRRKCRAFMRCAHYRCTCT